MSLVVVELKVLLKPMPVPNILLFISIRGCILPETILNHPFPFF
jgi:hypothetical protein